MHIEQNFGEAALKSVNPFLAIEYKLILHSQENGTQFEHQKVTSNEK